MKIFSTSCNSGIFILSCGRLICHDILYQKRQYLNLKRGTTQMAHEDAGHYSMKHQNKKLDPKISSKLENEAINGTITCSKVHKVARSIGIDPKEVGIQVDLMELRLKECSLGLFGYDPDGKNFDDTMEVSEPLSLEIKKIAPSGRTTCIQCWELASRVKMRRSVIGSACEKMGIKIKGCQLGAF